MSQYIFISSMIPPTIRLLCNGISRDFQAAGHVSSRQTQRLLSLPHGKDELQRIFGTKRHMDIFMLYCLEFLSGLMKDLLNFLKYRNRQMAFTKAIPIISQAVFSKARGSHV
jgi:hypothetical protein